MTNYQRILFPVDMSRISLSALSMATDFAKRHSATLCFIHVAPSVFPEEAMYGADYVRSYDESAKPEFEQLRPAEDGIEFEHIFLRGNAGPEIVGVCQPGDLVVLSTHGRGAIMRFVMGSVAEYVLHHADCPVILAKGLAELTKEDQLFEDKHFVTDIMTHVSPVHTFDNIMEVSKQLNQAGETAAPVVDVNGKCIGILTTSDIKHYLSLKKRYDEKDPTVINEMFEVDKYGMRRAHNHNFDYVERHMTKEVISIGNDKTVRESIELFEAHPKIHHLVVMDEKDCPVGIIDSIRAIATVDYGKLKNNDESDVIENEVSK